MRALICFLKIVDIGCNVWHINKAQNARKRKTTRNAGVAQW